MKSSLLIAPRGPRWYLMPLRVLLLTFFITLLSFAVSLLLGICGVALAASWRAVHPDLRIAYRQIAFPTAALAAVVTFVLGSFMELRHYRRARILNRLERQIGRAG
jgi:TRAP-type C4-dicarboxylate transport system permease small subunit